MPAKTVSFGSHGVMAILRDAIGAEYPRPEASMEAPPSAVKMLGGVAAESVAMVPAFARGMTDGKEPCAIVDIAGPLNNRYSFMFDSYDRIRDTVAQAIAAGAKKIVFRMDSPGGSAAGCIEASREIRAMVRAAGVKLITYVDGVCASAAYAIATASDEIIAAPSALVGSIGAIEVLTDLSEANAKHGVRREIVTSGAYKGQGEADRALTPEIIAESQARVNEFAAGFYDLCVEHGYGKSAEDLRSLEARVFFGTKAVELGLVTATTRSISSADEAESPEKKGTNMNPEEEEVEALLAKLSESEDEAVAAKAKAALAAFKARAEEDVAEETPPAGPTDDEVEAKAMDPMAIAMSVSKELHQLRAEMKKKDEAAERSTLLASRADFTPQMRAMLQTAPIQTVRDFCKNLEKLPGFSEKIEAQAKVAPSIFGQSAEGEPLPDDEDTKLKIKMGILKPTRYVVRDNGTTMQFGVAEYGDKK